MKKGNDDPDKGVPTIEMTTQLLISPERLISDVQKDFNQEFPYLKLEFFDTRSFNRATQGGKHLLPQNQKLGDAFRQIQQGAIDIPHSMKVSELENIFRSQFNLAVQVYRRSGNLWLETTMTDNWTLGQQNNHGMEITTGKRNNGRSAGYDIDRDLID